MGMYFFEAGKIASGLLGAIALAAALTGVSNRIFSHGERARPGYVVTTAPVAASLAAAEKPAPSAGVTETRSVVAGSPEPVVAAAADLPVTRDENKAGAEDQICQACDAADTRAVAKAGPPLFALVDRSNNGVAGLARSNSLRAEAASWAGDDFDQLLPGPHVHALGETDAKSADIVEYLHRLPEHPRRGRSK